MSRLLWSYILNFNMQKLSRKKHSVRQLFSQVHKTAAAARGLFSSARITALFPRHTIGEVITMSSKKNNSQNNSQNKSQNNSQNNSQNKSQNNSQNNSQNKSQSGSQN